MSAGVNRWRDELLVVCLVVAVSCVAAIPSLGWRIGLASVAAAVVALFVLACSMRVERREHEQDCRDLRGDRS